VKAAVRLVPHEAAPQRTDEDVRAKLRALSDVVVRALDDAKTLTEREVLAAGETLASILGESQAQLAETDVLTREFGTGPGAPNSLATVAGRLLEALGETPKLLEGVANQVDLLARTAQKAQADTRKILGLVSTVKRISASTKLLALNTRIEASRLGANEKALAVLSAEMRSLSDEVTSATEVMEQLAESLTENLPSVANGAAQLVQVCAVQAGGVTTSVAPFHAAYGRARQSVEGALQSSRERLERIQGKYTTILQNLQFQDRAQQQMQFAEDAARALAAAMEEIITLAEEAGPGSALGGTILERCRTALAGAQRGPRAPQAPDASTSGDIQFL
jgi:methyl-accepting chemotaxis protein